MLRVILVAVLATFIFSDSASAQQQSRRGRFFQRVKQDIFGVKPSTPTPSSKSSSKKTPTPSHAKSNQSRNSSLNNTPSSRANANNKRPTNSRSSAQARAGFGFELFENDAEQLIVSRIDPRGNGADAGLRRGDRVIEIGGIEANSVEEFDEISKVMNNGDQMGFKVKRNGADKEIMITFGTAPEGDQAAAGVADSNPPKRYDFAPPSSRGDFKGRSGNSVLDQPAPNRATPNARSISTQRNMTQHRFTDQPDNSVLVQQMRGVIERQNQQIRRLQSEITNLKRFGR